MNENLYSRKCNVVFAVSCKTPVFQQMSEFANSDFGQRKQVPVFFSHRGDIVVSKMY